MSVVCCRSINDISNNFIITQVRGFQSKVSVFLLLAAFAVVPMCQCSNQNASMDLATPRNAVLTAFYKR